MTYYFYLDKNSRINSIIIRTQKASYYNNCKSRN